MRFDSLKNKILENMLYASHCDKHISHSNVEMNPHTHCFLLVFTFIFLIFSYLFIFLLLLFVMFCSIEKPISRKLSLFVTLCVFKSIVNNSFVTLPLNVIHLRSTHLNFDFKQKFALIYSVLVYIIIIYAHHS